MEDGPRKATDVLLELESKIDMILDIVKSQDLNNKILSNKLNTILEAQRQQLDRNVSKPTIEVARAPTSQELERQIPISPEMTIPMEQSPQGFRRTSRPETYEGDNSYLKKPASKQTTSPVQKSEIIVPVQSPQEETQFIERQAPSPAIAHNSVPVMQRVVDKNSKSIFLADVVVLGASDGKPYKTRTNGTGKWMASLLPGNYHVTITKRDAATKEKVETSQDIVIDGKTSPLNLPMLIIK